MTQNDRLLAMLRYAPVCSLEMLDWEPRITRGAARVNDLRNQGYEIVTSDCQMHDHKTARHARYDLVRAELGSLF